MLFAIAELLVKSIYSDYFRFFVHFFLIFVAIVLLTVAIIPVAVHDNWELLCFVSFLMAYFHLFPFYS